LEYFEDQSIFHVPFVVNLKPIIQPFQCHGSEAALHVSLSMNACPLLKPLAVASIENIHQLNLRHCGRLV
jgi:hypothetical protein